MRLQLHLMPYAKGMLYYAVILTGLFIAYLLLSLVSNVYIICFNMEAGNTSSRRTLERLLYFVAYLQIIFIAILSIYEIALIYMLQFLCKLERTEELALLHLKNNPPLRMDYSHES